MAEKEQTPAELLEAVGEQVTVDLTIDPNDPRKVPVVDGNDLPVVDINEPVVEKKSEK